MALALVACWTGAVAPPPSAAPAVAQPTIAGGYRCSIEIEDGYRYPPFRCQIRDDHGALSLAKLQGSQRFHGTLTPIRTGFRFHGEMVCPFGDCSQPLDGEFHPVAGELRGVFQDAGIIIHLSRGGFGGASYGGDEYGGASYGFDFTNIDIRGAPLP